RTRAELLSPGQLVLVVSYTRLMYKPLRKLTGEGARLAKAAACAERVMDLLALPAEDDKTGEEATSLDGPVELIDVGYRYPDGRVALDGLNLRVDSGQLVVVNGDNGAGKSTLLSLLLRLRRPTEGQLLLDGTDIGHFQLSSYRRHVAYVPQDLLLFGGSVRENLAFARPEASEAELLAAARVARFTEVLATLPDGMETVLDEEGTSLSGGQARRLMLARAVLRDAPLILLDEPLAGLDPEARTEVAAAIRSAAIGRTTFVVHHGDPGELDPDQVVTLRAPASAPVSAEPVA
ncbi:MAG: ABC transporter ATP-binding protein, partial [Actinomycetota bacterium]